jgi:hypothetical protein
MRFCWKSGLMRPFTSRNDDAHASSVASIEPPAIAAPMIPESWSQQCKTSSKLQL